MGSLIYRVRRPLPTDRMRYFGIKPMPHLWVIAGFGWRVLIRRYGPRWWVALNRYECWKYRFKFLRGT